MPCEAVAAQLEATGGYVYGCVQPQLLEAFSKSVVTDGSELL